MRFSSILVIFNVGALGSTVLPPEPQKTDAAAHGFTEATQEGLYMALHNAKTSGKTGLGKGKGSGAHPRLWSACAPGAVWDSACLCKPAAAVLSSCQAVSSPCRGVADHQVQVPSSDQQASLGAPSGRARRPLSRTMTRRAHQQRPRMQMSSQPPATPQQQSPLPPLSAVVGVDSPSGTGSGMSLLLCSWWRRRVEFVPC